MNTNTNNYRPALAFYHANAKGTGCAVKMTLHPATPSYDGYIEMTAAPQKTISNRLGPNPTFATFDWENAISVRLDFNDLCLFLQVLRGETESVNDGRGIYKRTTARQKVVKFRHVIDPISGYVLELCEAPNGGDERCANFFMSAAEALGICEAITGSMYLVSFGVPMVDPHE